MAQVSAEKLEHTRPAEKERVASVPRQGQMARTPEPPLPKKKEQSRLSGVPNREGERVKVSERRTLERDEDQSGSMKRRGWIPR